MTDHQASARDGHAEPSAATGAERAGQPAEERGGTAALASRDARRALWRLCVAAVFAYCSYAIGLPPTLIGWLFGLQTVTILATRPVMGIAADRLGHRRVIIAGLTLCGAAVVIISLATSLSTLLPAIFGYAVGVAVTTAATSAFITDLARRARYGAAHGVFGTIYDVGDALGSIAAGLLVARVGYAQTFQIMAA